jgi:hypothetical protein
MEGKAALRGFTSLTSSLALCSCLVDSMDMLSRVLLCFLDLSLVRPLMAQKAPVDYVDPLIGPSNSRWMLGPDATVPFGMAQMGPEPLESK